MLTSLHAFPVLEHVLEPFAMWLPWGGQGAFPYPVDRGLTV